MLITCFIAYITATFMVEAISVANVMDLHIPSEDNEGRDKKVHELGRQDSLFKDEAYESAAIQKKFNMKDINNKASPFYVR
jgi:hypothetical protein